MDELNVALLLLRATAGVTLALHGYQKFFMGGRLKGTAGWFESLGMKPGRLHALLAACTEISCGLGLAAGLLTPLTAAGLVGIMVVAAWTHKHAFFVFKDGWEYNFVLGVVAVCIATIGPGEWSLDHAFGIDDDLDGWLGLALSGGLGIGASAALLLVFWRPPVKEEVAA